MHFQTTPFIWRFVYPNSDLMYLFSWKSAEVSETKFKKVFGNLINKCDSLTNVSKRKN